MMMKRRAEMTGSLVLLAAILSCVSCQIEMTGSVENKTGRNESRPRIFSPRMDYDEWTPLGRGDPLKNDPTFDYVPPVLDRVQYWLDTHTTEPSAKRDILVLGVTAKKTSPKIPEQFLKFVDVPKFNRNQEQQYRNEHILHRNDFTGSTGAEPPKIMRNTNFRNGLVDYRNHNRIQNIPASYYPSPYYNQKPKPYTMMLPPPVVPKPIDGAQTPYTSQKDKIVFGEQNQQFSTQTEEGPLQTERQTYKNVPMTSYSQPHPPPRIIQSSPKPLPSKNQVSPIETINGPFTPPAQTTKQKFQSVTTPSISFEKSNLVYHSTQTISGGWLANDGSSSENNQITWQPPLNVNKEHFDAGDHHVAASSSHEVVIGQNANIIVDGENDDNEEVVVGKKESVSQGNIVGPTPVAPSNIVQSSMFSTEDNDSGDIVVGQPSTSPPPSSSSSSSSSNTQMQIVVANTGPTSVTDFDTSKTNKSVTVIMPTNYVEKTNGSIEESKFEPTNVTPDNNPNTMTSIIEQTIQISNPIPPPNSVTNSPILSPQMNPVSQMNQMNRMNQINHPHEMHRIKDVNQMNPMIQMNHFPSRPVFVPPNAQPLVHHNANAEQMMMLHMTNGGMKHPGPSMPQMFNDQLGNVMQQRPSGMEYYQSKTPMSHGMYTLTTPRSEMVRDDRYHMQQSSHGASAHVPFLPTPLAPVLKPETVTSSLDLVTDYIKNQSPLAHLLHNNEMNRVRTSTSPPTTTTTVSSLTTDPIFSHYKQPAKPIRGPMYLIIQGHSKVKTYKPSVNRHGVPVENNEITELSTERPSKLEQLINENTRSRDLEKNLEKNSALFEEERPRQKRIEQENLLSLVESNFSGFTVRTAPAVEDEQQSNSVTTIEINN